MRLRAVGLAREHPQRPEDHSRRREVVLFPELASFLRQHKAASRFSLAHDYVFTSATGTPLNYRNVESRGFDHAVTTARLDLNHDTKPVLHDCRHTFASLLIAQGLDVVFISRRLGHASPATTLRVYAHLFDKANHANSMSDVLSAQFGTLLDGNLRETTPRNGTKHRTPKMAQLGAVDG